MKRAAAAAALAMMQPHGGLIDNVAGYTLDGQGRVERFNGLVTDDRGKVERLLQPGDRRPDRPAFRLDGAGRVMIPGLVDGHGHVMALGLRAMRLNLSATRSLPEAQARLAAWAVAHSQPAWITGYGWDEGRWGLGRYPTAAELDAAVADRPVWLYRMDGQVAVANSAALAQAHITAATPDPAGGRVERGPGRRPTGAFANAALALVERVVPPPLPVERDAAFAAAQDRLLAAGLTSTADMGTTLDDWMTFRRAGDVGRLRVRIVSYAQGIEPLLSAAGTGPTPWLYDDRLRMVGVRLAIDGALGSRGAWLKAPYADAPGERGVSLLSDAQLRNLMSRAAMDGFQVAVDATGDAANAQLLGAIDELAQTYKGERRWRIEQATVVDPADRAAFGRLGVVAMLAPARQATDRAMTAARLGAARLASVDSASGLRAAGARIAFGTDGSASSPFAAVAAAATRDDPEQVSLPDALAGFTQGAAYAAAAENRLGSLMPGRWADFILIDRDIFRIAPADVGGTRVLETWIAGKRAWVAK